MGEKDLIIARAGEHGPRFLLVEPYLTSSHEALAHGLMKHIPARWTLLGLSGRHFRWRMRGAASFLARAARSGLAEPWDGMVCSSMLDLAVLKGLVPELAGVPSLLYFHENQLAYPAQGKADQRQKERDLYLAFCNLASMQAAGRVLFNSHYQMDGFFREAELFLKRLPDAHPPGLLKSLRGKAGVLAVPLELDEAAGLAGEKRTGPLRLVWNHRWEQDKAPEVFMEAVFQAVGQGAEIELAVLGPTGGKGPEIFNRTAKVLGKSLKRLGGCEDRRGYWRQLFWADVVLSTALQENQGLAVAEAVWADCRPLVPDELAYPEYYPAEYRYARPELTGEIVKLAAEPERIRAGNYRPLVEGLTWEALAPRWEAELSCLAAIRPTANPH